MDIEQKARQTPHIWIKDIQETVRVEGDYLVTSKTVSQTRQGNTFLTLTLADRTGAVEARVWDRAEEISTQFKEGDIVTITGQASTYRNQIQIQIHELVQNKSPVDPAIFQESTPKDVPEMFSELKDLTYRIENRHLRTLIESFMADHEFILQFKKAPAAKTFHHSYRGGLLEHTLSVSQMAVLVTEHYPDLDGDLLLSGAILHDIGKIDELNFKVNIDYSDKGRLLGHIVLGVLMVEEKLRTLKDFPSELALRLKHLILSHHGEFDLGSPKRPKFLEAFALHLIDDMDAKINGLSRFLKDDRQEGLWTVFNTLFQRYLFKGDSSVKAGNKGKDIDDRQQGQRHLFPVHDR
ncbi:MAG: 3'-5' exoribonuclease YhaM family protein [Deltaproteobacteria bacterium]|nr:MAG: 3'-5' exoribonuclease YhaM family protein [Deltaproteobacteria bacterium]